MPKASRQNNMKFSFLLFRSHFVFNSFPKRDKSVLFQFHGVSSSVIRRDHCFSLPLSLSFFLCIFYDIQIYSKIARYKSIAFMSTTCKDIQPACQTMLLNFASSIERLNRSENKIKWMKRVFEGEKNNSWLQFFMSNRVAAVVFWSCLSVFVCAAIGIQVNEEGDKWWKS